MNIVGFAFKRNISSHVLKKLPLKGKYFIDSDYKNIDIFVEELITRKPKYIMGLGMYSRRDQDTLRIETHYSNGTSKQPINYFLSPGKHTKLANGIGNSWCNYVSSKIMALIENSTLDSKYTFIHIPKKFQPIEAVDEIESMLSRLK